MESRRWGMVRAGAEDPRGLSLFPFTSPASLASERPNGCSAPGPTPQQDTFATHSRGSAQPAGQGLLSRGFCSPDKHHAPGCRTHGFTAAVPGASQEKCPGHGRPRPALPGPEEGCWEESALQRVGWARGEEGSWPGAWWESVRVRQEVVGDWLVSRFPVSENWLALEGQCLSRPVSPQLARASRIQKKKNKNKNS